MNCFPRRNRTVRAWAGLISLGLAAVVLGEEFSPPPPASEVPTVTASAAAKARPTLAWATQEVLKLCRAKVSEETVITFVGRATTSFDLTADDVVYLKDQGVSDRILNAMLSQRPVSNSAAAPITAPPANPAPTSGTSGGIPSLSTAPGVPQTPTVVYQQPAPVVVYQQPAPVVVQSSPTYVYSAPYYSGYSYYPYYPSYGWRYPSVSLSFGFGNYGGYRGGYRGCYVGGYHGGGYHGGGGYRGGGGHGGHR